MTQEFVAETLGVSRQAVSKWESGISDPSTTNLMALAKLFGVTVEDEEVNKFLPWYPIKDIEETKHFYEERYISKYLQPQAYAYAICLKEDNYPIGYINVDMEEHHDFG